MDVVVIGGTGFIGKYLVDSLAKNDQVRSLRLLSRKGGGPASDKVEIVRGNVFDKSSLDNLLVEGAVVVNLAYLVGVDQSKNIELISNIIDACKKKKVRKFIHVSTAVVVGRVDEGVVTEESVVCPFSEYDKTKLLVEQVIASDGCHFESIILRPTAVFGPEGKNLAMLASALCFGNTFKNYLKSCLYGARTMNLVSVQNVVSALSFLILIEQYLGKQIFIVSDDEASSNNYIGVENILMRTLGISDYLLPRMSLPQALLRCVLIIFGKSNVDAKRRYSSEKLETLGWTKSRDFEYRVKQFAEWYKGEYGA